MTRQLERFKTMSTVEMMCENENVNSHVTEWEKRCLKAEAQLEAVRRALYAADKFITNGVELGFIRMPDEDVPDPAKLTPGIVKAALAALAGKEKL